MRELVKVLKAVADPNRLRIFKMLQHKKMCVCELSAALGISAPSFDSDGPRSRELRPFSGSAIGEPRPTAGSPNRFHPLRPALEIALSKRRRKPGLAGASRSPVARAGSSVHRGSAAACGRSSRDRAPRNPCGRSLSPSFSSSASAARTACAGIPSGRRVCDRC